MKSKIPTKNAVTLPLNKFGFVAVITAMVAGFSTNAHAAQYLSLSFGSADLSDSANSGSFPNGFTTGAGTSIPAGTALGADTAVGWNTEFDSGDAISLAWGLKFENNVRIELAYSSQDNEVSTHSGVTVADTIAIDSEDAGVLITGSGNLGASVGAIVADGRGSIDASYFMVNGYLDFPTSTAFTPYIGAGVGYVDADIVYNPSAVSIVDTNDSGLAYQLAAGATFELNDAFDLFGQVRYLASDDFEVETTLFPARLEIENESTNVEIGVRYKF